MRRPSMLSAHRRLLSALASPHALRQAVAAKAARVDLRTPEERAANPGPPDSVEWDFRADPTMPADALPEDKTKPIILF